MPTRSLPRSTRSARHSASCASRDRRPPLDRKSPAATAGLLIRNDVTAAQPLAAGTNLAATPSSGLKVVLARSGSGRCHDEREAQPPENSPIAQCTIKSGMACAMRKSFDLAAISMGGRNGCLILWKPRPPNLGGKLAADRVALRKAKDLQLLG